MPMHELVRYGGRNPAPTDLDAYWSAALAELERTGPEVVLEPNRFPAGFADCFDLWFTGVGGARVHAKYVRPRTDAGPHPALLHFHGYSMRSPDWARMLGWVGRGYSVAALDCRGQG